MLNVKLNKAISNLTTKTIRFRLVEECDAAFILSLRLDNRYNKHLSKVEDSIDKQTTWIKSYKQSESRGEQYYFVIAKFDGTLCGTVRIYDFQPKTFCWGSWILNSNKTRYAAIESAMLVYHFGFDMLGFENSQFEVQKDNIKVVSFHQKFGAMLVSEDDINYYFRFDKNTYLENKKRYESYIK